MLPPPTTIATSTPRRCTSATSRAMAWTRSGSVPYSRSPISASPESFSSTRRNAAGREADVSCCAVSATDREPGKATDHHILTRLAGKRRAELLDRPTAVLVLVDVLLAEQHHVVEPLVDLALDDALTHVLGAVGSLLGGDPRLALTLLRGDLVVADGNRRRRSDVERQVARELDEPVIAGDEVRLAVDLDEHPDL